MDLRTVLFVFSPFRMSFVVKAYLFLCWQDGLTIPTSSLCQMQSLLLLIMSYVANVLVCNNTSAQAISDQVESSCFVDAAIVFCKLQHLSRTTPIKTQVSYLLRDIIFTLNDYLF
jgi:calcineurin-binding protein cabin-1